MMNTKADILLLDEPTSHIDADSQKYVLDNLFESQKNKTVLMVAHRLKTAIQYCDKVIVLENGEIAQFDEPLKLLTQSTQSQLIDKKDSIFAEMVLANGLSEQQQSDILKICRSRINNLNSD